jgi:hypothetical protein
MQLYHGTITKLAAFSNNLEFLTNAHCCTELELPRETILTQALEELLYQDLNFWG